MSNIQTGAERMPHDLSHLGFLVGQICRIITISTSPVIAGDSFEMDVFFFMLLPPLSPTLFPYTTLFRSDRLRREHAGDEDLLPLEQHARLRLDRKSTRLNSSHVASSYAVFCLKKKNFGPLLEDKLCLIFKLAPSVCRMTFPILASLLVRFVVLLPFQLLRLSLATPSRWTFFFLCFFLH